MVSKRREADKCYSLFLVDRNINIFLVLGMKFLLPALFSFSVLGTSLAAQNFLSVYIKDVPMLERSSSYYGNDLPVDEQTEYEASIADIFGNAIIEYHLVIDDSTTFDYDNTVNLRKFPCLPGEAFVVITGTDKIDGKYFFENHAELAVLSSRHNSEINIEGSILVPFNGGTTGIGLASSSIRTVGNIYSDPLNTFINKTFYSDYSYGNGSAQIGSFTLTRGLSFSPSSFQVSTFTNSSEALASYSVDPSYSDSDGDGYAAWRDDDDTNPSITQADGIYTLSSALTEIASLESQKSSLIAERDARPTQAAYNAVVADRDARLTMDEVRDARVGSTMVEVSQGKAYIAMTLEETSDLSDWSSATTSEKTIEVDAPAGTRFFRFKMTE